jgi:putative CocE/NonD family hydrolase
MNDAHWMKLPAPALSRRVEPRSFYVPMPDGVQIAIDVYLPPQAPGRVFPTILRQTRYMRSLEARWGRSSLLPEFDLYARTRRVFLGAGYAWVDADVRGTGVSSGRWAYPWSEDEVTDGARLCDWIVGQPWSAGIVGSLGISYDGTCADMLVTTQHSAIRAVAPMFSLYDVFTDVAFPGGIHLSGFTERWAAYNAALDSDEFDRGMSIALSLMGVAARASPRPRPLERILGVLAREGESAGRKNAGRILARLVRGVRAVDRSAPRATFDRSTNMDVHAIGKSVVHRDDVVAKDALPEGGTIDLLSPHARRAHAQASGVPIYSYSGWRDGAYQHAAIKRFLTVKTPGSRLTLGPWVHTGKLEVPAFDVARTTAFDHDAELLAFFDQHLMGRPRQGDGHPVHYFTMVEGRWKSASTWPPPEATKQVLHLSADRTLDRTAPASAGRLVLVEDGTTGTRVRSRWRSLLSLVPGDYPDRAARDARLLCCESAPLVEDTEVTGHPLLTLNVSCSEPDAHLFVYLEDVAPDGRVSYVTEGQLRLLHRRVGDSPPSCQTPATARSFLGKDASTLTPGEVAPVELDLLPISWRFERGHRIRLALAGADKDHFDVMAPRTIEIHSGPERSSRLELPVVPP